MPTSASGTPFFFSRNDVEKLLHCWPDVVVHPEEIAWVVAVLQSRQALVIRSIRRPRRRLALVRQIILIGVLNEKRLQGIPRTARPLDIGVRFRGSLPVRPEHQVVGMLAVRERRVRHPDARRGSMPVLEKWRKAVNGRALSGKLRNPPDGLLIQIPNEVRFHVRPATRREERIEHTL